MWRNRREPRTDRLKMSNGRENPTCALMKNWMMIFFQSHKWKHVSARLGANKYYWSGICNYCSLEKCKHRGRPQLRHLHHLRERRSHEKAERSPAYYSNGRHRTLLIWSTKLRIWFDVISIWIKAILHRADWAFTDRFGSPHEAFMDCALLFSPPLLYCALLCCDSCVLVI